MLMPTLSVTLIGVLAALGFLLGGRGAPSRLLVLGLAGAWTGFLAGALIGVSIDVLAATGVYVAIVGHLVALVGAVVALGRLRALAEA